MYNLYLGGSFQGDRLASLYASNINEANFIELLDGLFERYVLQRQADERFGDFLVRRNLLDEQPEKIQLIPGDEDV